MSDVKRVTVTVDLATGSTSVATTGDGGGASPGPSPGGGGGRDALPDSSRRRVLADLYQALSEELVRWQGAHPGEKETSASAESAPVVWRLHRVAKASVLDGQYGIETATTKMNDELTASTNKLGASFNLLPSEVARLAELMTNSDNKPLAPYDPYDQGEVRARIW